MRKIAAPDPAIIYYSRQDRYIRRKHTRYRFQFATITAQNLPGHLRVSSQTIRNRLRSAALRVPILIANYMQRRSNWAQNHLCLRRNQWVNVLFMLRAEDGGIEFNAEQATDVFMLVLCKVLQLLDIMMKFSIATFFPLFDVPLFPTR